MSMRVIIVVVLRVIKSGTPDIIMTVVTKKL